MEQAHEEWENTVKRYREHLDGIGSKMTELVRELARGLCLHDAYYLGLSLMPHWSLVIRHWSMVKK